MQRQVRKRETILRRIRKGLTGPFWMVSTWYESDVRLWRGEYHLPGAYAAFVEREGFKL
jgi:hypothetical protein